MTQTDSSTRIDSTRITPEPDATAGTVTPTAHTELPWGWRRENASTMYSFPPGLSACSPVFSDEDISDEDAEFIVTACNAHHDLLAALKACSFRLATMCAAHGDFSDSDAKALDAATAAIAKGEAP